MKPKAMEIPKARKVEVTDLKGAFRDLTVGGPYERQLSCNAAEAEAKEFIVGELYFMLWYPDQKNQAEQTGLFLVPDSLVFVGRNLDGNEDRQTWYFQDTKSYCAHGAYPNNDPAGLGPDDYYGRLYALHEEDLYQVVDCGGLIKALAECIDRRKRAAKPG